MPVTDQDSAAVGEPWGRRMWLALAATLLIAVCLEAYGIATWPMADDEVPSLVEMGLAHVDAQAFSVPAGQIGKLPRAVPVWYTLQRRAIDLLPQGELSYRLPTLLCAILVSALAFLLAARWRGLWFAAAASILVNGSPLFLYIAQIDRFYCLALLMLTLTLAAIWWPRGGIAMAGVTPVLTVLTVLSHNVTVAVFGMTFLASCCVYVLGRLRFQVLIRSGVAAATSGLVYVLYLRPLVQGWSSTGNPTPVLVSFAAQAGIPLLSLALFGSALALLRRADVPSMLWWVLMFAGGLCVIQVTSISWNPRYFLFLMPPVWVLAAYALDFIASRLGRGLAGAAWYASVVVVLVPGVLSHYQDGSRHDYRQAAAVVLAHAAPGESILSDDAETISYYLPADLRANLFVRTKVTTLPPAAFLLVCRSNAWMPLPQVPGRQMQLLAEIEHRRYDEFSHILRIYSVAATR